MKKIEAGLFCLGLLICIISCDISETALPESATLKSAPGTKVPIGKLSDKDNIAGYFSVDNIKKMTGIPDERIQEVTSISDKLVPYKKTGSDTRTYLIHKPIAYQELDLTAYVQSKSPGEKTGDGTYQTFPIAFPQSKWITKVTKAKFIVKITMDAGQGAVSVSFSKPNSGKRITKPPATEFTFESDEIPENELSPQNNFEIEIGIKVSEGETYTAEFDFDWEEATVNPTDDNPTDKMKTAELEGFDLSRLRNFLGGSPFKAVTGYIYAEGFYPASSNSPPNPKSTLTSSVSSTGLPSNAQITEAVMPKLETLKRIPASSVGPFDLTDLFNSQAAFSLTHQLTLNEFTVTKAQAQGRTLRVDMVIELPLEFTVSDATGNPEYAAKYVSLKLESQNPPQNPPEDYSPEIMPLKSKVYDIFGRTDPENGILKGIDSITVRAADCKNNVFSGGRGGITLGVYTLGNDTGSGFALIDGQTVETEVRENFPFAPTFELLIQKDDRKDTGTLRIIRPKEDKDGNPTGEDAFDFLLEMDVKAALEIEDPLFFDMLDFYHIFGFF
ncbi:MAG: hypothetical protein LBG87_06550 [Spirochaetaceae bacterium]|nr:hypothetical protein [Spirochaetaceae bacterium]